MTSATRTYSLQITEADVKANVFRVLGGATWLTRAERDAALSVISERIDAPDGDRYAWIVDVLDDDSIVDDREVDESTVLRLLGSDSIKDLRAVAIARDDQIQAECDAARRS